MLLIKQRRTSPFLPLAVEDFFLNPWYKYDQASYDQYKVSGFLLAERFDVRSQQSVEISLGR